MSTRFLKNGRIPLPSAMATLLGSAALLAAGCINQPGMQHKPSVRASTALISSYDVDTKLTDLGYLGYTDSSGTDYTSFEVGVGVVSIDEAGTKKSRAELVYASVDFDLDGGGGSADGTELAAGGRYYVGQQGQLSPFLSVYSVITEADVEGFGDLGTQLSLRFGGGVEYQINENIFFDAGLDWTLPLSAAETDVVVTDGFDLYPATLETEFSGMAIRIGVGATF